MSRFLQVAVLAAVMLSANAAEAQYGHGRDGSWDFGLTLVDQSAENLIGEQGSTLEIAGRTGWGITAMYNLNDYLAVGLDFGWNRPNYLATRIIEEPMAPNTIRTKLDMFSYELKAALHFIDGPITPFVEASAGWTNMDSNIPDQPPTSGCWWDPWWGYICDSFYSTYSKTRFSYGGAAGLRADLGSGLGIKASYGVKEIDTSNATQAAVFNLWKLELLWKF